MLHKEMAAIVCTSVFHSMSDVGRQIVQICRFLIRWENIGTGKRSQGIKERGKQET
jgi:hypothetical protein